MKIYTRTGDDGGTALFGGGRVRKHDTRVDAYGNVDELNSVLGWAITQLDDDSVRVRLGQVQHDLFAIGSDLATPPARENRARPETPVLPLERVASMEDAELEGLLDDPGIIRHRGKVWAFRQNARAWIELAEREGDPVEWLWAFVGGQPKVRRPKLMEDYLVTTPESGALSKALRKAGFNFVGATTMHAYMQAVGMVDEHAAGCFRASS